MIQMQAAQLVGALLLAFFTGAVFLAWVHASGEEKSAEVRRREEALRDRERRTWTDRGAWRG